MEDGKLVGEGIVSDDGQETEFVGKEGVFLMQGLLETGIDAPGGGGIGSEGGPEVPEEPVELEFVDEGDALAERLLDRPQSRRH